MQSQNAAEESRAKKAIALILAVLETVAEQGEEGTPSTPIYLFWSVQGGTLAGYSTMMANLVGAGWLRVNNHTYYVTPKGQELIKRLQPPVVPQEPSPAYVGASSRKAG